jgi:hypothetical protein
VFLGTRPDHSVSLQVQLFADFPLVTFLGSPISPIENCGWNVGEMEKAFIQMSP